MLGANQPLRRARLLLEDGSAFDGIAFGAARHAVGEVVFTTGMVGYTESLTDPSYRRQILVMTYPLVGNYGVPASGVPASDALAGGPLAGGELAGGELPSRALAGGAPAFGVLPPAGFESERIQVAGLVVAGLSNEHSHWRATTSLEAWLAADGVPGIAGVDTRAITQRLRDRGTLAGRIVVEGAVGDGAGMTESSPLPDIGGLNLVAEVSTRLPLLYEPTPAHDPGGRDAPAADGRAPARRRVVLVDCGVKASIIRSFLSRGVAVLRVPWDADPDTIDADGIVVSNGPGDPARVDATVAHLRRALDGGRPLLGICLGNQLIGRAAGCETYKLPFGHRGQNQPCREAGTPRCHITSQNHGYAVDPARLPDGWEEWFVNANDGSNEGIRHRERPLFGVQFHPEASPGPRDTSWLFDLFVEALR